MKNEILNQRKFRFGDDELLNAKRRIDEGTATVGEAISDAIFDQYNCGKADAYFDVLHIIEDFPQPVRFLLRLILRPKIAAAMRDKIAGGCTIA